MAAGPEAVHRPDPRNGQGQAPSGEHRIHQTCADYRRHERDRQCSVRVQGAWRSYERTTDEDRRAVGLIRAGRLYTSPEKTAFPECARWRSDAYIQVDVKRPTRRSGLAGHSEIAWGQGPLVFARGF